MKLVMKYGGEPRALDMTSMPIGDAIACEQFTDMTWTDWRDALFENRALAVQFAWWLAGRREGVTEKFSAVDLDLAQMDWSAEFTDEEQAALDAIEALEKADDAGDADAGGDADEPQGDDRPTGPAEIPAG